MTSMRWCICLILLCAEAGTAQTQPVWVYFSDKGPRSQERLLRASAEELDLSREALLRRASVEGMNVSQALSADELLDGMKSWKKNPGFTESTFIDEKDLPLHEPYVEAVQATGVRVRARSKWMNAISVDATQAQIETLRRLSSVTSIVPVRRMKLKPVPDARGVPEAIIHPLLKASSLMYGEAYRQLDLVNVPKVHDVWIDGTGISIGMLDTGFKWRTHEAMKNLRVLGEYDFINRDSLTENESNDPPGQDGHGTLTFSALGGYQAGRHVGPAFGASYYLAKTEVNSSETRIEEDYYAEGIEWIESRGAAVSSSSLAYSTFDDSTGYTYENGDFDGQTAVCTRAAARAARLGVVVVTAMGNDGPKPGTILAPADADSILSIGAVTLDNQVATFSSRGPTNDGRTKPDVVAPGVGVYCATNSSDTTYTRASGTSLATPIAAGVAALVRSARPELSPIQVREALRETADQKSNVNNNHGWGTINAWDALLYHGMVISTNPKVLFDGRQTFIASYILSPNALKRTSASVTYAVGTGPDLEVPMLFNSRYPGLGDGSGLYVATLPSLPVGALIRYFITGSDIVETRTSPHRAPGERFHFFAGLSDTVGAGYFLPTDLALDPAFPNPVSNGAFTTIRYRLPQAMAVTVSVYNSLGRRTALLVDEWQETGSYEVPFNASRLASGVYMILLRANDRLLSRGIAVIR